MAKVDKADKAGKAVVVGKVDKGVVADKVDKAAVAGEVSGVVVAGNADNLGKEGLFAKVTKDPFYLISAVFLVAFALAIFTLFFPSPVGNDLYLEAGYLLGKMPEQSEFSTVGDGARGLFAEPADEDELFEMIICPCCGSPISAGCCGGAIARQKYVRGLVDAGASKGEVLLSAVKKYGFDSLADENVQDEIRKEIVRTAPEDRPVLVIESASFDFGDVSFAEGTASTSFTVKNSGKSDLIITGMESSCGCTSAAFVAGGIESPRFSMPGHGQEQPKNWSATLKPGEGAELKVYYDPTAHPDLRGPVTRTVSVFSNDPINFGAKVQIEVNQVD